MSELSPSDLRAPVDEICRTLGDEFVTGRHYKMAREAWAACRLVTLIAARAVSVSVFGRNTPVELDYGQVKPLVLPQRSRS